TEKHAPTEKAHRRRRGTPSTTIAITAKTPPLSVFLAQQATVDAARLAWITRAVQYPATDSTTRGANFRGQILIDPQQQRPELGSTQEGVAHWRCPVVLGRNTRQPPRGASCKLLEGVLRLSLNQSE